MGLVDPHLILKLVTSFVIIFFIIPAFAVLYCKPFSLFVFYLSSPETALSFALRLCFWVPLGPASELLCSCYTSMSEHAVLVQLD